MPDVDWSYHRNHCASCSKAAAFLSEMSVKISSQSDARKTELVDTDALRLLGESDEVYVTRGTKVVYFDLRQSRPDDAVLLDLLIGRSGKLRAPTLKVGKTLVVGFDRTTYEQVFGVK